MNSMLIAAWLLRTLLLVLWIPFLVLSGLVRVLKDADCWSSAVIEADFVQRIQAPLTERRIPVPQRQLGRVVTMPLAR